MAFPEIEKLQKKLRDRVSLPPPATEAPAEIETAADSITTRLARLNEQGINTASTSSSRFSKPNSLVPAPLKIPRKRPVVLSSDSESNGSISRPLSVASTSSSRARLDNPSVSPHPLP